MRLVSHPAAEAEVAEAARSPEGRSASLGERFLREDDATTARNVEAPDRWRVVEADLRRCLMRRFPYGFFKGYEVHGLVVKHHSHHPDDWRDRQGA